MNMSEYTPDSWKLVKLVSPKHGTIYKVLASWYGGFTQGNSWKLSSGVESVSIEGDLITLPQSSGSVYVLHKNNEHISSMMHCVYASFQEDIAKAPDSGITLEMVELDEAVKFFEGAA
jgi:hypothetical protein